MKEWIFTRGSAATSSLTQTTIDDYYSAMIGSIGVKSQSISSSREFADLMVSQLTEQRGSVSAVSLDEEMISLIKYQQAYTAASKLLTTLLSVR